MKNIYWELGIAEKINWELGILTPPKHPHELIVYKLPNEKDPGQSEFVTSF